MRYLFLFLAFFLPFSLFAQEPEQFRVKVVDVVSTEEEQLPGLDRTHTVQVLEVRALSGPQKGELLTIENDYFQSKEGESFFVTALQSGEGEYVYAVGEPDRRLPLILIVLLAAGAVILLGGMSGLRALLALAGGIGLIIFALVPGLLSGIPPLLIGGSIAILILALVMTLTHGFSKVTLAAFIGTTGSVIAAGILASLVTSAAKISGFVSDESVFLNTLTQGTLNFSDIFLIAVIIGMIGVLDDVAVTQAAAVREMLASGLSKKETLVRCMRIGREHVGALVNTLALAYAGASLPLLLVFAHSSSSLGIVLNREIFAAEIIRTAVGTIGIVLAVPLTTFIAVMLLTGKEKAEHTHSHV